MAGIFGTKNQVMWNGDTIIHAATPPPGFYQVLNFALKLGQGLETSEQFKDVPTWMQP